MLGNLSCLRVVPMPYLLTYRIRRTRKRTTACQDGHRGANAMMRGTRYMRWKQEEGRCPRSIMTRGARGQGRGSETETRQVTRVNSGNEKKCDSVAAMISRKTFDTCTYILRICCVSVQHVLSGMIHTI